MGRFYARWLSFYSAAPAARGAFGPPRDLVVQATTRLCRAIEAARPAMPVGFILMSSVSVNRPGRLDPRRGMFERAD